MSEPPHLLLEGKASCMSKVEPMIMDLFQNSDGEGTDYRNNTIFIKSIVMTSNNNGRYTLDRVKALENDIGMIISSDDAICNKIMRLEHEVFGKAKSENIMKMSWKKNYVRFKLQIFCLLENFYKFSKCKNIILTL